MAVLAVQALQKMRGGSQAHLMLGEDGNLWVVKFQNNPQHLRVLANEFLATGLARIAGLTVPQTQIIDVPQWIIDGTKELMMEGEQRLEPCRAGLQFGSQYIGGLLPGQTMDYLPECFLGEVINRDEFPGMLVMDKWMCNSDGRQAIFHKHLREKHYTATFIDQGYCFEAGAWTFTDAPLRGVYARNLVYQNVKGWGSFEPWLKKVEAMDSQVAWNLALQIPEEWYAGRFDELEQLIERLFLRRKKIRDLICHFRDSSREPFPQWKPIPQKNVLKGSGPVLEWSAASEAPGEYS